MRYYCQPCKERGREQVAHRIVGSTPMCEWCGRNKRIAELEKARAIEEKP